MMMFSDYQRLTLLSDISLMFIRILNYSDCLKNIEIPELISIPATKSQKHKILTKLKKLI